MAAFKFDVFLALRKTHVKFFLKAILRDKPHLQVLCKILKDNLPPSTRVVI